MSPQLKEVQVSPERREPPSPGWRLPQPAGPLGRWWGRPGSIFNFRFSNFCSFHICALCTDKVSLCEWAPFLSVVKPIEIIWHSHGLKPQINDWGRTLRVKYTFIFSSWKSPLCLYVWVYVCLCVRVSMWLCICVVFVCLCVKESGFMCLSVCVYLCVQAKTWGQPSKNTQQQ